MSRLRALLIAALSVLLAAGLSMSFVAEASAVRKWPGGRITYVDLTKDPQAVKAAVRAWNRSGLKVRFVKVRSARRAQLLIRDSNNVPAGCGTGLATLGYTPGRKAFVNIKHGTDAGGQACALPGQTIVLTHELGHVLGLGHNDKRCSVMNSSHTNGVAPTGCIDDDYELAKPGHWRCRLLEKVDLQRARKMYGGRIKVTSPAWCDAIDRIPATGPVTITVDQHGQSQLSVVRGPEPAVPGWLGTWGYGAPGFEVHATPGACTAVPGDDSTRVTTALWEVPVGATQSVSLYDVPAGSCVSVWQFDRGYNHAKAGSTLMTQVGSARVGAGATPEPPRPSRTREVIPFD